MQTIHFIDDDWVEGEPLLLGPLTHATWMASVVFDGARAFEGVAPDLDRHCERLIASAHSFGLKPRYSAAEVEAIARDGIAKYPQGTALYIRPMYFAEKGAQFFVAPDPDSTRFCLSIFERAMPEPGPMSVCLSSFRRPAPDMAPTDAKASCLYPNSARALMEATKRGFDNAVVLDPDNNVAELATANIWIGKGGVAHTPAANGTFLNGVTRQRVANLLRADGIEVTERTITWDEVLAADEVFTTGNLSKVMPITRVEDRELQPGPLFRRARELYWDFAHQRG
ncbi:MAG: branched-chain amino acid aminotransferase [Rhodospirillales bacterium]|nr:MAG: branched-chain amino acid aminotransferase [Rhodospirillales bacterium]